MAVSFVQSAAERIPVYGPWRVAVVGCSLVGETLARFNMSDDFVTIGKISQQLSCLGTMPILKSYWVYIPSFMALNFLSEPTYSPKQVVLGLDVSAKVINVFAVGLFAKQLFEKKSVSMAAMAVSSAAMAGLSVYNVYKDFYPTR